MNTLLFCGTTCCAASLALAGVLGFGVVSGESPRETVHQIAHAVGAPCCNPEDADGKDKASSTSAETTYGDPVSASEAVAAAEGPSCAPAAAATAGELEITEDEKALVNYIADRLMEGNPPAFEADEIEAATGVSIADIDEGILRTAVVQELNRRGVDLTQLFGENTCSQLSACSVHRNLAGAQGEELEKYHQEKALDGKTYANWTAPEFSLPSTSGKVISLSDTKGRPVAVVLLSGHCTHSMDTLPILARLREKYAAEDLAILPIYVNSGTVDDISSWASRMNLNYPLLVDEGKNLSDEYESYLVPSTFLIDREGQVTKKLVGFKDQETLDQAFHDLIS